LKQVKLDSGATLGITPSPFLDAKDLYQAVLRELRGIPIKTKDELGELFKNFFVVGFSSLDVERCLWKCFERCTYDGGKGALKIDKDTFEPVEARQDYMKVCLEVARENIDPFVKSLYAEYRTLLAQMEKDDTPK
jgi:hypothetical protein